MKKLFLATDLDGTLVGDTEALKELNKVLLEMRTKNQLKIAYVTGRSLESCNHLLASEPLLSPDALVAAMGTEIYWNGTDFSDEWPTSIEWSRDSVISALSDLPEVRLQPESGQLPHKVSFYLDNNAQTLDLVRQKLNNHAVDVLYSHQQYLDILPKGINKGSAITYLAKQWGIEDKNILACGDSANDIDMLTISDAIIVANAQKELFDWVARNHKSNIYLAKQAYAAGISEGLRHFKSLYPLA